MSLLTLVFLPVAACACALAATRLLIGLLQRRQILDRPNTRSSHVIPVPRGGGIALLTVVLLLWAMAAFIEPTVWAFGQPLLFAASGAVLLAAVSWVDDLRGLGPLPRLLVQAGGVTLGLAALPGEQHVFQGLLPFWLDRLGAGLAWIWFVNLYNFMDGIDGIAASETVCIGIGIAAIGLTGAINPELGLLALVLAAAALGFLRWNWQPAKIFLGDVGSVPVGYLTGWLLLLIATQGAWSAALLLPLYFLADATFTLMRRFLRGDRVWRPHREHLYQQAVRRGLPHARVVGAMLGCNAALVALAVTATAGPAWVAWATLATGAACTLMLMWWMAGGRRAGTAP